MVKKMHCETDTKQQLKQRLNELQSLLGKAAAGFFNPTSHHTLLLVMEGLDAAGKTGCIKRVAKALDPTQFSLIHTEKPTESEYRRHYLWRFWQTFPEYGKIALYDRSWYGRVLVERVEGLATRNEWSRAYHEINNMEEALRDDGAILVKIWLNISEDEQLRRFLARKNDPDKAYKLTDEDWRNRSKRAQYDEAAADMLRLTNTIWAPWTVIDADDKPTARIRVLEAILSTIEIMM